MTINELKKLLVEFEENLEFKQSLKKKNWFNIGGKAKVFYKANNLNTLITDDLYDGVIIKLGKNFNNISLHGDNVVIAGSAVLDKNLSEFAMNNNISGFEFLSCIPGTIGGGIRMNAGCFEREFKDILISVQAIDKIGNVVTIPAKDIKFDYRKNDLSENLIFLSASFKGVSGNKEEIYNEVQRLKIKKEKNQPSKIKTSGSTFKNPILQTNKKVWELIKESVPLDTRFGDAYISEKHCNFFVNNGNASFKDMKNLIEFVSKKVLDKTGINLEKEIKILE